MKLQTVEAYFLEPLKAYFEKDPKDGAESFIVERLEGTDVRVLEAAVDWIKANRQAQTSFPSPKECFAAVVAAGEELSKPRLEDAPKFGSDLTYGQKAKSWAATMKRNALVHRGTHEYTEWQIYYLATGNRFFFDLMLTHDSWTTPTVVPQQFDDSYDWSRGDRLLREWHREQQRLDNPSPERRQFVADQLARIGIRVSA